MRFNTVFTLIFTITLLLSCNHGTVSNFDNTSKLDSIKTSAFIDSLSDNYIDDNNKLITISDSFLLTCGKYSAKSSNSLAHFYLSKSNYFLADYYLINRQIAF